MQTFERAYKGVLLDALKQAIPNRKITVSNDLHYKPLEKDAEGLVAIIQTGMGTKSAISGYDMNTVPVVINFVIQANYLQELLGALDNIAKDNNGLFNTLNVNNTAYNYKTVYSSAYPIGAPFDVRIQSGVLRVIAVNWTLTLTYSHNAIIEPITFKLIVDTDEFDINYIIKYDMTSAPSMEPVQYMGNDYQAKKFVSNSVSYSFVLLKVLDDEFQSLLQGELTNENPNLRFNPLKLKINDRTVDIRSFTVTEIYENNASVLSLVLTR